MIKKIFTLILFITIFLFNNASAQCPNGDVEFGNFTNWQGWTGLNNNPNFGVLDLNAFQFGFVSAQHSITNAGTYDPIAGGTILPTVADGNYAIKLGNTDSNWQAQIASYTFVVPPSGLVSFKFALVLEEPLTPHTLQQKPFFSFWVSEINNLAASISPFFLIPNTTKKIFADNTNPFFTTIDWTVGNMVVYKNWQTECVNLEGHQGETLTIFFATAGCALGGHWGYGYIDDVCEANNPVPDFTYTSTFCNISNGIWVDGSTSTNYNDVTWTLQKLNSNNINDVIGGTDISQTFTNSLAGQFDVAQMYVNGGGTLTNGYYKLTLRLNNCGSSAEKSVIIQIALPQIDVPNVYGCCNNNSSTSVTLNATITVPFTNNPGTVSWYDVNNNFIGHGTSIVTNGTNTVIQNSITVNTSSYSKYKVTYSDNNGCYNEAWTYAIAIGDIFKCGIHEYCTSENACAMKTLSAEYIFKTCVTNNIGGDSEYVALTNQSVTYLWNTGETTKDINTQLGIEDYSVTITWPCSQITKTLHVPQNPFPGSFDTPYYGVSPVPLGRLYATSGMVVGSQNFVIYETGIAAGIIPAYNAYHYRLCIFNRWGQIIWQKEEYTCSAGLWNGQVFGFWNGQIAWDGTGASDNGTYYYTLELQNCDNNNFCPSQPAVWTTPCTWMHGEITVVF